MNVKHQLTFAFLVTLLSLLAFSFIAVQISTEKIGHFDQLIIAFIQGLESPFLTSGMKFFTFIGSYMGVVLLTVLILCIFSKIVHQRTELILFVMVITGSVVLNRLLKEFFHRARPDLHQLIEIGGFSFPSGHAMNAFTVYGILTFLLWQHIPSKWLRVVLISFSVFMISAIGISRIYLGVHFPSDILGGYFAGGFWLSIAIGFFQDYKEKRSYSSKAMEEGR